MALGLMFHRVGEGDIVSTTAPLSTMSLPLNKFMSQVLRKVNFDHMIDLLADSQPRLQQSILNILNMCFKDCDGVDVSLDVDPTPLQSCRSSLIHHQNLMVVLGRLVEMSNLITLRGKAILCINLMSRYAPVLLVKLSCSRFHRHCAGELHS